MTIGAGTYTIRNNQAGDVTFLNSDGNQVNILPGNSAVVNITASTWASLYALLGAAQIVSVVLNPTYEYTLLAQAPVATPTDFLVIQGSATKTVNVTKLRLSGGATSAAYMPFTLVRRLSTGGTQGSAVLTAITPGLTDINISAATAVVSYVGTANYTTVQTANGVVAAGRLIMPALATGGGDLNTVQFRWSDNNGQPLKLRGATDYLCINFGGTAVPAGGVIDAVVETYEDNS